MDSGTENTLPTGNYSEQYTTKDELIKAYNSEGSLTLDEYKLLNEGGELSVGKRNFSEEQKKEYNEQHTTQTPTQAPAYDDNTYSDYDYNQDYNYNDYDYNDYGYDYNDYDYNYDYGYNEW